MSVMGKILAEDNLLWNKLDDTLPIIFWGCGNSMYLVKDVLKEKEIVPTVYCDNNSELVGTQIEGIPVLSYKQIKERYSQYILILTVAINNAIPIMEQLKREQEKNPVYHVEHPFKVEDGFLNYETLESKYEAFQRVYEKLQDEVSKKIFVENINFKLGGNKLPLLDYIDGDSFFDTKIIPKSEHYSYMDVGAYTGDTLLRFYAFCEGQYDKLYAVEPDTGNFKSLSDLIKYGRLDNVSLFHVGGWDKKGKLTFYTVEDKNNTNFDSPNFFKGMEGMGHNSWGISKEEYGTETIKVDTVDNILNGEKCNVIKINAVGADYQVLRGCKKTIEQYKPILVGEFGAQKEHYIDLLSEICEYNPGYKLYLRQKMIFGDCKTCFYAIEPEK